MKAFSTVVGGAGTLCLLAAAHASMMPMGQMGGTSFMINLVSPPAAAPQIRRGILMVSRGMMAATPTAMMTPGAGPGSQSSGLQIRLLLSGVSGQGGTVTSVNNHLYISGSITAADASTQPIDIDRPFGVTAGTAMVVVPITTAGLTPPAVVQIDNVAITDDHGNTFAVPGFRIAAPVATATAGMPHPTMTPGMGMGPTMTPHMGPGGGMGPGMGGS